MVVRGRQKRRLFFKAFKTVGADKVMLIYVFWFFIAAVPIWLIEPHINSYGDSLWFCFASATSIGYGDIYATTVLGRIVAVILSVYSIGVIAIFTAVIVNFFNEMAKARADASVQKFTDDLEHLPELSKEELERISKRVKEFLNKK
jgi:voltage-gated potassium channel